MPKRKAIDMENVEAPGAVPPAQPKALVATLTLSLADCNKELVEQQAAQRELHEVYGAARRQAFILQNALLRGDKEVAECILRALEQVPEPVDVVGELWQKLEVRARLSDELCNFQEGRLTCLMLKSFFETGVITVPWPEAFQSGISSIDDERYLLSLITAVRELERFAVGRARVLDLPSIRTAWTVAQCVEQAMLQFDFRNGGVLRQRYDALKYVVKRLETIAYEVDLAQQRGSARGGEDFSTPPAATSSTPAVDVGLLGAIKERYDKFTDVREQVIKRSRDVGKGAKNAVYALQREDFAKADQNLLQCSKEANAIFQEFIATAPTLRGGGFSSALEEMVEAISYRAFLKDRLLLNKLELQKACALNFEVTLQEYLGGLMDLTGEVGRLAIRQASRGREAVSDVELCLACVEGVCSGAQELVSLGGVGKKMGAVKTTMLKIEGVLYELALLSQSGLRAQAPEHREEVKED